MNKNSSIRKRMILSCLFLTLIPIVILDLTASILTNKAAAKTVISNSVTYVNQLADNYQGQLNDIELIASTLSSFVPLKTFLTSSYASKADAFHYYEENVHPMLTGCSNAFENTRIRVYHSRDDFDNFSFQLNRGLKEMEEKYISEQLKTETSGFWLNNRIKYNVYEAVLSYYLPVRSDKEPWDILYVISMHMNEQELQSQIINEQSNDNLVFLLDKSGVVLASNNPMYTGNIHRDLAEQGYKNAVNQDTTVSIEIDNRKYIPILGTADDIEVLYLLSSENIHNSSVMTSLVITGLSLFLIAIATILVVYSSNRLTKNIYLLKERIDSIDGYDSIWSYQPIQTETGRNDEIIELEAAFVKMMKHNSTLVEKLIVQEERTKDEVILRRDAEVKSLQSQINPHYLFNTLEAIRMNLVIKGDREDANIVKIFAESFRHYMDTREEFITLAEELNFIQKYIQIQNFRFNNRIGFSSHIPSDFLQLKVLKLTLQPLIENAVCHGIEQKEHGGNIILQAVETKGKLIFTVQDDGIGIDPEKLQSLREHVSAKESSVSSIGLRNVYKRIRLKYGDDASMTIDSEKGNGTKVTLELPIERMR